MTSLESLFFKNEITLSAYRGTFVGYNERINRVILFSVSNVCIFAAATVPERGVHDEVARASVVACS